MGFNSGFKGLNLLHNKSFTFKKGLLVTLHFITEGSLHHTLVPQHSNSWMPCKCSSIKLCSTIEEWHHIQFGHSKLWHVHFASFWSNCKNGVAVTITRARHL